jgi:hypothetical protein
MATKKKAVKKPRAKQYEEKVKTDKSFIELIDIAVKGKLTQTKK